MNGPVLRTVLAIAWCAATLAAQDSARTLTDEYARQWSELLNERRAAVVAGDTDRLLELAKQNPTATFLPRFVAGATEHAGTPDALPYLDWLLRRPRAPLAVAKDALTQLEQHADDPAAAATIAGLHETLPRLADIVPPALTRLAQSKTPEVRAAARYALAMAALAHAKDDEAHSRAIANLEIAVGEAGVASWADPGRLELEQMTSVQVGQPLPEVSGVDLDGVPFSLADYHGRAMVLVFWAAGWPPARRIFAQTLEMAISNANQPLVFLGVDGDPPGFDIKGALGGTYPCWRNFSDGPNGPIATKLGIHQPTALLLDASGILRERTTFIDEAHLRALLQGLLEKHREPGAQGVTEEEQDWLIEER